MSFKSFILSNLIKIKRNKIIFGLCEKFTLKKIEREKSSVQKWRIIIIINIIAALLYFFFPTNYADEYGHQTVGINNIAMCGGGWKYKCINRNYSSIFI